MITLSTKIMQYAAKWTYLRYNCGPRALSAEMKTGINFTVTAVGYHDYIISIWSQDLHNNKHLTFNFLNFTLNPRVALALR